MLKGFWDCVFGVFIGMVAIFFLMAMYVSDMVNDTYVTPENYAFAEAACSEYGGLENVRTVGWKRNGFACGDGTFVYREMDESETVWNFEDAEWNKEKK